MKNVTRISISFSQELILVYVKIRFSTAPTCQLLGGQLLGGQLDSPKVDTPKVDTPNGSVEKST